MPMSTGAIALFFSYAKQDELLRDELAKHLTLLQRRGVIHTWHDRQISPGSDRQGEIDSHLNSAQIILLLVSPDFLASDYCYDTEVRRAMERHEAKAARVIPIILRPVDWQIAPFGKLQALPKDGTPVTKWVDRDEAFLNIEQGIRQVVEELPKPEPDGSVRLYAPTVSSSFIPSVYDKRTWVERSDTDTLIQALQAPCRILALSGITGIGKTALAERLIDAIRDDQLFCRFNLDEGGITPDFITSGSALLRKLGEEPTLEDQKDAKNLLAHLVELLRSRPYRVQIDSMERLLEGNDRDGWSEFCDPLWNDLFQQVLSGSECQSQLILTTQDVPAELETIGSRYPQFWYCEPIRGLSETEQLQLFEKRGISIEGEAKNYLTRLGNLYAGHPLVLRVIAEDLKACGSDIKRYWKQCHFDELEASRPVKFSRRKLQLEVRERVKQAIDRLPDTARQLLCRCSVYRRPVPESFWLAMLDDEGRSQSALDLLKSRALVEEDWTLNAWLGADDSIPLRQHNLIRNVAYGLLKTDLMTWETAEQTAAIAWLVNYEPRLHASNLEKIHNYIEHFHHLCELRDWETANTLLFVHLDLPENSKSFCEQLRTWGYHQELIQIYKQLVGKLSQSHDAFYYWGLGIAHDALEDYSQALKCHENSLTITREIGDRYRECNVLGNLGITLYHLGNDSEAIEFLLQSREIAREIGDRQAEGSVLNTLGNICCTLGNYSLASQYHQQSWMIACEIGDFQGEGIVLTNLGLALMRLHKYPQALENLKTALKLLEEIGDLHNVIKTLLLLAELHQKLGEIDLARELCDRALAIATELGIPLVKECEELKQKLEEEHNGGNG